jgi:hypothetical protein
MGRPPDSPGAMLKEMQDALAVSAFPIGGDLVLDIFQVWRRKLPCLDALILLAIARSNVDGVLYSRELRARYGGANPIAPNDLRQPVSVAVLALSLGLTESLVARRVAALAARNECVVTRDGMLITENQLEASDRLAIVQGVYTLLAGGYGQLRDLGFMLLAPLPAAEQASSPPVRSASAHAAKYCLSFLGALADRAGDVVDALALLYVMRASRGGGRQIASAAGLADVVGLTVSTANRRLASLAASGLGEKVPGGFKAGNQDWLTAAARQNQQHLFQLLAGLAEVGAIADFETSES